ncbi:MAG: hypothetical protein ABF324_04405 [Lentimonas sp.]
MKRLQLIIGLIGWSASLILAFVYGHSVTAPGVASEDSRSISPKKSPTAEFKLAAPDSLNETVESTGVATEAGEVLSAYFKGADMTLTYALSGIDSLSPSGARDFLNEAFSLPASDPNRSRLIAALLSQLATTNPQEAYGLTAGIGSFKDSERAKVAILEVWAKRDPVTALAWAQSALVDEPRHLYATQMNALFRGYTALNPRAAFAAAQALSADSRDDQRMRGQLMSEVIETQVRDGQITEAKLAIELISEPDTKERMTQELVGEWAKYDPAGAAGYIESLGDTASTRLKTSLVDEWAENDPAAAAAWLSGLDTEDPAVARAASDVIREWTRYDLTASAEWLNSLPVSADIDRAVASYTMRAAQEDPRTAMSWAESISSDWARYRMMKSVAETWKSEDPDAFEAYVEASELSAEQKEDLRKAESRGGFGGGGGGPGRRGGR